MDRLLEIRTYRLKPGTLEAFHQAVHEHAVPMLRSKGMDVVTYGPSDHEEQTYHLVRAYESREALEAGQAKFYGSSEWRDGPRSALVDRIETYLNTLLWLSQDAVDSMRTLNNRAGLQPAPGPKLPPRSSPLNPQEKCMNTQEIANHLVAVCKAGNFEEALPLYAPDAVSVEASAPPGSQRETVGIAGIRGKGEWWVANHEVHSMQVAGPWPHDDRFIVGFKFDVTMKATKHRFTMEEMALYTVKDGKIVREEFFYSMG